MMRILRSSLLVLSCMVLLLGCGSAAPTGGTSTPVAIELPAIAIPTSLSTDVSDVAGTSLSTLPEGTAAAVSAAFLRVAVTESGKNFDRMQKALARGLAVFDGMSCAAQTGGTTCRFTNASQQTVQIDFRSFAPDTFSANQTNQSCNLDCVADTNTALSNTAICMRVWVNNARHLIGKFTIRPTAATSSSAADKGAGCLRVLDTESNTVLGVIYDKSTTTTSASTGPNSYLEMFVSLAVAPNSHGFSTETGTTAASQLVNFNLYGNDAIRGPQLTTARWVRNVNVWYGNVSGSGSSGSNICATKAGVETTGCGSNLTSPALPSFLSVSVSADTSFPSTSVFPTSPTF